VNIWYDVSDLTGWRLPHLTGIQRVTVGILAGLTAQDVQCRLVRFDPRRQGFVVVDFRDLPETIRRHLPLLCPASTTEPREVASAGDASAAEATVVATRPPDDNPATIAARRRVTDPATQRLRESFRAFRVATRDLRRDAKRWVKTRLRPPAPVVAQPPPRVAATLGCTRPQPGRDGGPGEPFAAGDVLVSLGATWGPGGHAEAASQLRQRGVRVLRMIYDLIPTLKLQWVLPDIVVPVTAWVRRLLTESDHVFTISEFSRQEIVRYCDECGFRQSDISVVRLGDVMEAAAGDEPPPLPRFVPQRPFFMCVSTLDVRKNHRLLYDAWRQLASQDADACPDLLCIGTPHLYVADLLREMKSDRLVNGRIHLLHGIDDRELAWYYRHCAATIYPSWYEGWGLPVAESLALGKICLASNATSIPEISADLPEFFEPHDTRLLVDLVGRVLRDHDWRARREDLIRRTFRPTAWTDTAAQILDVIRAASGRPNVAA
jgi:glycosyltransferase involved in cell wall biosynthesis